MNALQVINLFVETSGRYNFLETVPGEEDGEEVEQPSTRAYHYLNSAQRWLDRELGYPKENSWLLKTVPAGTTIITFNQARYVQAVYNGTTRLDWQPAYFDNEYAPEDEEDPETHWPLQGIEIKSATTERTIKILAAWYSPNLSDATSVSFWTVQHPDILVRAMQMQVEIDMRNTQGVNDFMQPLQLDVRRIYQDMIAEKMSGPSEYWRMD